MIFDYIVFAIIAVCGRITHKTSTSITAGCPADAQQDDLDSPLFRTSESDLDCEYCDAVGRYSLGDPHSPVGRLI